MSWKVIIKLGHVTMPVGIDMLASARTLQAEAGGAQSLFSPETAKKIFS